MLYDIVVLIVVTGKGKFDRDAGLQAEISVKGQLDGPDSKENNLKKDSNDSGFPQ
jgi:hypothetical protein